MAVASEALAAQEETQFKGHVEARKIRCRVQLHRREVIDAEFTFLDEALNFGKAEICAVIFLKGAPGHKAQEVGSENDRTENVLVSRIERAIDEYVIAFNCLTHRLL